MTNSWDFANTAAGRVLRAIQLRGKARVDEVAADLGVSASAVRQHLGQLQASGAVRTDRIRDGVGRPYHVYSVTPQGHQLFHNDYGDLARFLLEEVGKMQEPQVFRQILTRIGQRLAQAHRDEIRGDSLEERLQALSAWLERRGVPVGVEKTGGGYELEIYGCPYPGVAIENHAVCEIERQVMARLLSADVRRIRCVLSGAAADDGAAPDVADVPDSAPPGGDPSLGGCKFTIHEKESRDK